MFFRSTRKYHLVNSVRNIYHVPKISSVVDLSFDVNTDEQCSYLDLKTLRAEKQSLWFSEMMSCAILESKLFWWNCVHHNPD